MLNYENLVEPQKAQKETKEVENLASLMACRLSSENK